MTKIKETDNHIWNSIFRKHTLFLVISTYLMQSQAVNAFRILIHCMCWLLMLGQIEILAETDMVIQYDRYRNNGYNDIQTLSVFF